MSTHLNGRHWTVDIKKAQFFWAFCTDLDSQLVEAGGVEPPSEDSLPRATTCVSGRLGLVPGDPGRQGSLRTIPGEVSPFGPPGGGFGLSREGDPLAPIRAFDGRGQAA